MKYSTKDLLTVPVVISPKTIIGAATSPRLKASFVAVNWYVGLVAFDVSIRATLLFANITAVRFSEVQYAFVVSKIVLLKTWLFPK